MRLKTQFVLITVIFGALLVAVSVLAVIEGQRVNQANQEEQLAGDIARGADELGYLSNDYVVYRGSQQLDRWQTRFASFSEQISNLRTNGPQEGLLANNIRADSERMNEVFNGIISAVASFQGAPLDPGVLQASWSQMAVPSQSLASDATRLSQMAASVADGTLATRNAITYALIGLFVLFILAVFMLTNRRVMRSISILQTSAAVVGSGDLDHKIEEKGNDEITELARSFNQMTSDLKMVTASKSELEKEVSRRIEAEAELMASNEELQEQARRLEEEIDERKRAEAEIAHLASFPELNPNPVIELSATGTITYANAASKKFFPDLTSLGSQHPFLADAVEAIRKGEAQSLTTDVEFGGAWYLQTLTYVPSTASYRLYASNITARKQAEGQLGRSNAELEAANKELEAFTYSVSHDLREPLRAIDGFSRILLEDYRDRLDAEGQRLLSTIRTGTERMGQLIADLLALSRLGRQHMKSSETDMRKLTQSVWNELASSTEGRKVDVKVDELPAAVCDPSLMQQVMVNLLSNAIKFTRPKEAARIEVGSLTTNGESVYYVKDNGVGFDMRYADKLFGIFQRLHSREEFEGTGVGLAIVQRIVHRHGGRVWAESRPGEGATFYFSLPERRPDHERG